MIGKKPIWLVGVAISTIGSALSGAAPSLDILIAARLFQGLGGALLFAVNVSLLTSVFPVSERGRALGLNAVIVALGISACTTICGIITQNFTCRLFLYVNVPLGYLHF